MKLLSFRIAARYLFGRKSYSAVNAISAVALTGVAVAVAAMVCVMSVFNGFREMASEKLSVLAPDLLVEPVSGRPFEGADSLAARLAALPGVADAQPTLTRQALALYEGRELPFVIKGVVPGAYRRVHPLAEAEYEGSIPLRTANGGEDASPATVSVGFAAQLGIKTLGDNVTVFAPKRTGRVNMANPMASFMVDSVCVTGIYRTGQKDYDENLVLTDIERVRQLLLYDDQATAIEITLSGEVPPDALAADIAGRLGVGFAVKDRMAQHADNFRMVNIEKWVTFLLLFFILAIASFNIISTVCMLVLEKADNLHTLAALGMTRRGIGRVFAWESWMVTAFGAAAGMAVGVTAVLLQQHYGLVKLHGNPSTLVYDAYPVRLEWLDLLYCLVPVLLIGGVCAWIASAYARRRMQ